MDHYADDLAALTAHLDLKKAVHVGHSTGGGEVVHYLARHAESRVAKARPPGRDTGRPLVRLPAPGLLRFRRDNLMLRRFA